MAAAVSAFLAMDPTAVIGERLEAMDQARQAVIENGSAAEGSAEELLRSALRLFGEVALEVDNEGDSSKTEESQKMSLRTRVGRAAVSSALQLCSAVFYHHSLHDAVSVEALESVLATGIQVAMAATDRDCQLHSVFLIGMCPPSLHRSLRGVLDHGLLDAFLRALHSKSLSLKKTGIAGLLKVAQSLPDEMAVERRALLWMPPVWRMFSMRASSSAPKADRVRDQALRLVEVAQQVFPSGVEGGVALPDALRQLLHRDLLSDVFPALKTSLQRGSAWVMDVLGKLVVLVGPTLWKKRLGSDSFMRFFHEGLCAKQNAALQTRSWRAWALAMQSVLQLARELGCRHKLVLRLLSKVAGTFTEFLPGCPVRAVWNVALSSWKEMVWGVVALDLPALSESKGSHPLQLLLFRVFPIFCQQPSAEGTTSTGTAVHASCASCFEFLSTVLARQPSTTASAPGIADQMFVDAAFGTALRTLLVRGFSRACRAVSHGEWEDLTTSVLSAVRAYLRRLAPHLREEQKETDAKRVLLLHWMYSVRCYVRRARDAHDEQQRQFTLRTFSMLLHETAETLGWQFLCDASYGVLRKKQEPVYSLPWLLYMLQHMQLALLALDAQNSALVCTIVDNLFGRFLSYHTSTAQQQHSRIAETAEVLSNWLSEMRAATRKVDPRMLRWRIELWSHLARCLHSYVSVLCSKAKTAASKRAVRAVLSKALALPLDYLLNSLYASGDPVTPPGQEDAAVWKRWQALFSVWEDYEEAEEAQPHACLIHMCRMLRGMLQKALRPRSGTPVKRNAKVSRLLCRAVGRTALDVVGHACRALLESDPETPSRSSSRTATTSSATRGGAAPLSAALSPLVSTVSELGGDVLNFSYSCFMAGEADAEDCSAVMATCSALCSSGLVRNAGELDCILLQVGQPLGIWLDGALAPGTTAPSDALLNAAEELERAVFEAVFAVHGLPSEKGDVPDTADGALLLHYTTELLEKVAPLLGPAIRSKRQRYKQHALHFWHATYFHKAPGSFAYPALLAEQLASLSAKMGDIEKFPGLSMPASSCSSAKVSPMGKQRNADAAAGEESSYSSSSDDGVGTADAHVVGSVPVERAEGPPAWIARTGMGPLALKIAERNAKLKEKSRSPQSQQEHKKRRREASKQQRQQRALSQSKKKQQHCDVVDVDDNAVVDDLVVSTSSTPGKKRARSSGASRQLLTESQKEAKRAQRVNAILFQEGSVPEDSPATLGSLASSGGSFAKDFSPGAIVAMASGRLRGSGDESSNLRSMPEKKKVKEAVAEESDDEELPATQPLPSIVRNEEVVEEEGGHMQRNVTGSFVAMMQKKKKKKDDIKKSIESSEEVSVLLEAIKRRDNVYTRSELQALANDVMEEQQKLQSLLRAIVERLVCGEYAEE